MPTAIWTHYAESDRDTVKSQLGLFASKATTESADEMLWLIIDTHYLPNMDSQSRETVRSGVHDILQAFTQASTQELDQL